jgi:hypothetical protein
MHLWYLTFFCLLVVLEPQDPATRAAAAPAGVIVGTVTDESGKPMVGARVQAVGRKKKWAGEYYEIPTGPADDSDDRGQFRLHSLPPGEYVVAAFLASQPPAADYTEPNQYVRTYNPRTTSLAEAEPIAVEPGKEHSVSVSVVRVQLVSVRGVATTAAGLPAAGFDVMLRGGAATVGFTGVKSGYLTAVAATTRVGQDGAFTLIRVPPGSYVLSVTNGSNRHGQAFEIAEIPIEVRGATVSDVAVATARGATVSGRLEWAGGGPTPWPRGAGLGRIRATAVGRESDYASLDADIRPDGTFQFTDLYGLRRIQAMSLVFNWAVKSVEGPKAAMAGPNLDVKPGTDITDVRVLVTDRTGTLLATVVDENEKPFESGSVLLMPSDPADLNALGWGYRATQRNRGANGIWYYEMVRVLPGSYLVVALDVEPYRVNADADLMERARAAAVPVEIREGQVPVRLRVVRLRPFVQETRRLPAHP